MSESEFHQINRKLDEIANEIATVKRGVYGDRDNKVLGLIDRTTDAEARLDAVDKRQWKAAAIIGGFLVGVEIVWNFFKGRLQ
jgi:hypothetical protein